MKKLFLIITLCITTVTYSYELFDYKTELDDLCLFDVMLNTNYKTVNYLERKTRNEISKFYKSLENIDKNTGLETPDYKRATNILLKLRDNSNNLKSYDRSILWNNLAYLSVIEKDLETAARYYDLLLKEKNATMELRSSASNLCAKIKTSILTNDQMFAFSNQHIEFNDKYALAKESFVNDEASLNLNDWVADIFVDEFGDTTKEKFLSKTMNGNFSNSATQSSDLRVSIFIDSGNIFLGKIWFRFYEYANNLPLTGLSTELNCRFRPLNKNLDTFGFDLARFDGDDRWILKTDFKYIDKSLKPTGSFNANYSSGAMDFRQLIIDEGSAKFICYDYKYAKSQYNFTIDFKNYFKYLYMLEKDPT